MQMPRTTVEIEPSVLKQLKVISLQKTLKVKQVADAILRYGLLRVDYIFPSNNRNHNRDNGK